MSTRASSSFTIDSWREEPYDELAQTSLTRAHVGIEYHGDFEGMSTGEFLVASVGGAGGVVTSVGFERLTGSLNGRSGSFILHASGARSERLSTASVLADSGTDELLGLTGDVKFIASAVDGNTFILDYELP